MEGTARATFRDGGGSISFRDRKEAKMAGEFLFYPRGSREPWIHRICDSGGTLAAIWRTFQESRQETEMARIRVARGEDKDTEKVTDETLVSQGQGQGLSCSPLCSLEPRAAAGTQYMLSKYLWTE